MRSRENVGAVLAGGALAGIGASVCCVGPLLLLSLGIGGAWISRLTALEPIRPVFIVLAFVFLGLAFWRLYLAPQVCAPEAPGENCVADRTRRAQRIAFWIVLPAMIALMAAPWWIPLFDR
jgi:mercuric ion transport protein